MEATLANVYEDTVRLKDLAVKLFDEHAYVSESDTSVALELLREAAPLVEQLTADYDALTKALTKSRG